MKLTRRSFLGLLSAIPFTPLIAKDMADFEFLPPQRVLPILPKPIVEAPKFSDFRPEPVSFTGQIRYNLDTQSFQVFDGVEYLTLTMEKYQNG